MSHSFMLISFNKRAGERRDKALPIYEKYVGQ